MIVVSIIHWKNNVLNKLVHHVLKKIKTVLGVHIVQTVTLSSRSPAEMAGLFTNPSVINPLFLVIGLLFTAYQIEPK